MTQKEWLAAQTPEPLITFLEEHHQNQHSAGSKTAIRYTCNCRRMVWDRLDSSVQEQTIKLEKYLAELPNQSANHNLFQILVSTVLGDLGNSIQNFFAMRFFAWKTARSTTQSTRNWSLSAALQAAILRDIAGNPYQHITFDPTWRTTAVTSIAESIRTNHRNDQFPILGDALIDAGCRENAIIDHCQLPGEHFPGCWVIETILKPAE